MIQDESGARSAGDILRQAREAHGLHVATVAAALKVPTQKIEALEADDYQALPDPVFVRALAASVCRVLHIDPAQVLAKLPQAPRAAVPEMPRASGQTSFRVDGSRFGDGRLSRRLVVVVALLLVGAGLMLWLPSGVLDRLDASVSGLLSRGRQAEPDPSLNPPATESGMVAEPARPALPLAMEGAAASAPAAPAAQTPAAAAGEVLVLTARATTWIAVNEAGGKRVAERTMEAGETLALSGALPLTVVIGRASGVDVQVRGQALDLAPFTSGGGVARFEVKP